MKIWHQLGKLAILTTLWVGIKPALAQYVFTPGEPIPKHLLDPKVQREMMNKPFDWELFRQEMKRAAERERVRNQRNSSPPEQIER